jgi:ABC-type antimicrobial peptide transport system ATPase subunit
MEDASGTFWLFLGGNMEAASSLSLITLPAHRYSKTVHETLASYGSSMIRKKERIVSFRYYPLGVDRIR